MSKEYKFENRNDESCDLWIEPWGHDFILPPNKGIKMWHKDGRKIDVDMEYTSEEIVFCINSGWSYEHEIYDLK